MKRSMRRSMTEPPAYLAARPGGVSLDPAGGLRPATGPGDPVQPAGQPLEHRQDQVVHHQLAPVRARHTNLEGIDGAYA